jgi:phosphotransacetylase
MNSVSGVDIMGSGSDMVTENDTAGNTDDGASVWDIFDNDTAGTYFHSVAEGNVAQALGTTSYSDTIAEGGVTFATVFASATESDALVQGNVGSGDDSLANDDADPMVNEKTGTKLSTGMDVNAGENADEGHEQARQNGRVNEVENVNETVNPHSPETGVGDEVLPER